MQHKPRPRAAGYNAGVVEESSWISLEQVLHVNNFRDADGRTVGERSADQLLRESIPTTLKQCPYPGSRHQHAKPMNVSALKQITRTWEDVLSAVCLIRDRFLSARGQERLERAADCHALGETIAALPSYLVYRPSAPVPDGALDPTVSALYKVIIGITGVYEAFVSNELLFGGAADEHDLARPEDVANIVEVGGFLIGNEEVCAGSSRQISDAIAAMTEGGPLPPEGAPIHGFIAPVVDYLAFADGVRRVHAASVLCSCATVTSLVRFDKKLDAIGEAAAELRETSRKLVAEIDLGGTIGKLVAGRSGLQISRLLDGWFRLAGGTHLERAKDLKGAGRTTTRARPA